jgi:SAM-dependent methyltransferase
MEQPAMGTSMTTTAWEEIYGKGELLERDPHPEIAKVAELFEKSGIKRILDLGSGGGRHTVYLAERGFDVYGLDSAPTGLAYTVVVLGKRGLSGHLTLHDMITLPYDNNYFDAVISIQVIHHNKIEGIRKTIAEITRVLRSEGFIWITMPVSKNEPSSRQEEVEPGTFLPLDGREKGLPHHYFRLDEIAPLFPSFQILDLHVDPTNHFSLLGRRTFG